MRKSNFALRMQPSLLEEVRKLAEAEGVAVNQFINVAVAEKLSALRTESYFRERAARANVSRAFEILKRAGPQERVSQVTRHGPRGPYEKVEAFKMDEVASGKVFLAYGVNGQTLPQKHGFPLRAVATDRVGSEWVKYVYKLEAR